MNVTPHYNCSAAVAVYAFRLRLWRKDQRWRKDKGTAAYSHAQRPLPRRPAVALLVNIVQVAVCSQCGLHPGEIQHCLAA